MKITAELVRLRQEWDPDSNQYENSVVFEFGGVTVTVPASAEQVRAIIVEAERQKRSGSNKAAAPMPAPMPAPEEEEPVLSDEDSARLEEALDDALSEGADQEEMVFGGDFVPADPQEASAPQVPVTAAPAPKKLTPTQQRLANVAVRTANDPAQQRKAERTAMRERAAALPPHRVAHDEVGNPVIPTSRNIVGPGARPTVVMRPLPSASAGVGDDDGFGQG